MTLREILQKAEREAIVAVLRQHIGTCRLARAAKALGVSRKTLWVKMRQHEIDKALESPQERLAIGA